MRLSRFDYHTIEGWPSAGAWLAFEPRQNRFQSRDGLGPVALLQVEQDLEAVSLLADIGALADEIVIEGKNPVQESKSRGARQISLAEDRPVATRAKARAATGADPQDGLRRKSLLRPRSPQPARPGARALAFATEGCRPY